MLYSVRGEKKFRRHLDAKLREWRELYGSGNFREGRYTELPDGSKTLPIESVIIEVSSGSGLASLSWHVCPKALL